MTRRIGVVLVFVLVATSALAAPLVAQAAWPQTPPNDPDFAPCENAITFNSNCYLTGGASYDQFDMFGALNDSQYPCPSRIGIFVDRMATEISMISGTAAMRVNSPNSRSAPQTISAPCSLPSTPQNAHANKFFGVSAATSSKPASAPS